MKTSEFEELVKEEALEVFEITPVDTTKVLPPEYQEFASIFDKKKAYQLPPH